MYDRRDAKPPRSSADLLALSEAQRTKVAETFAAARYAVAAAEIASARARATVEASRQARAERWRRRIAG